MSSEPSAAMIRPSANELTILEHLIQDRTNSQIAVRMRLSEQTIKTYMQRLISLTKVNSRVGLAVAFIRWRDQGLGNPYWDDPEIVYSQMGRGHGYKPQG